MAKRDIESFANAAPANQAAEMGELLGRGLYAERVVVDAAANSTAKTFTVKYDMYIVDVVVQCNATSSSGTLTLRNGTTAISDGIACAANHALDRAATLDDAQVTIAAGTELNLIANGAGDRGTVYVIGYRY